MVKEEYIMFRIHADDKKRFQEYCDVKSRSMSEILNDFIKLTLVEWDKSKN